MADSDRRGAAVSLADICLMSRRAQEDGQVSVRVTVILQLIHFPLNFAVVLWSTIIRDAMRWERRVRCLYVVFFARVCLLHHYDVMHLPRR